MAQPKPPQPVLLIVGMLSQDPALFDRADEALTTDYGPLACASDLLDFSETHYYDAEMGHPLYRKFLAFAHAINPGQLPAIKHHTNRLEQDLAAANLDLPPAVPRPINLDPGYIEPSKLVLATTKNYAHRIYIGDRIYAEITLLFRHGRWQPGLFTYSDYASGRYDNFLNAARQHLLEVLKSLKHPT